MNDIVIRDINEELINELKECLTDNKRLGMLKFFLGTEIARSKEGMSQPKEIALELILEAGLSGI